MGFIKEETINAGYIVDVLNSFEDQDWDKYLELLQDNNNLKLLKTDNLMDNLFIESADNGLMSAVKELIEAGADIHAKDDIAIILAADSGHIEMVKYLHGLGLSLTAQNNDVMNAAVYNDNIDIVKFLVDNEVDFSSIDKETAKKIKQELDEKR